MCLVTVMSCDCSVTDNIANPHHNGLEAVTGSRSGALASLQALEKSSNLVLMALAGQLCTGPKYKADTPT